jgi:DNA topoisomerase-1
VTVAVGRFGPFAKRGATYASLGKEDDPYTIEFERAKQLILEKEELARNRLIKVFEGSDIQVLNGRYGPYISDGERNGKIPKDREPASLTLAECEAIIAAAPPRPARGRFGKTAPAKKVAAKKAAAKKAVAAEDTSKAPAKKAAAKKAPAKKAAAKKAAAKKAPAKKAAVKKAAAKKAPAKKAAAKA